MSFLKRKFFKRLLYLLIALIVLLVLSYFIGLKMLRRIDISFESISYKFPSSIEIRGFEIKKPYFVLRVKKAQLDLSMPELIRGKFCGNKFYVNGLDILTFHNPNSDEDTSTSTFSYSSIPYIQFKKVEIYNAILKMHGKSDTNSILFPEVCATQFLFNDSILADSLIYRRGEFLFTSYGVDENDEESKLEIPNGVPKFNANYFELDGAKFSLKTLSFGLLFNQINLLAKGRNTAEGMNLEIKNLSALYQNLLQLNVVTKHLIVENGKFARVQNLKINGDGLNLNLAEIGISQKSQAIEISVIMDESRLSPSLLQLFFPNDSTFKPDCQSVVLKGNMLYASDSLVLNQVVVSLSSKSMLEINGNIASIGTNNTLNIALTPLTVAAYDLDNMLTYQLPNSFKNSVLKSNFQINGNTGNANITGNILVNSSRFELRSELKKTPRNSYLVHINLHTPYLNPDNFLVNQSTKIKGYNLTIVSNLEVNNKTKPSSLTFNLFGDSVSTDIKTFVTPNVNATINNEKTVFWADSKAEGWKFLLETRDNIFNLEKINFNGFANFNAMDISKSQATTGRINSKFNGQFKSKNDKLFVHLDFDSLSFKSNATNYFYSTSAVLNFEKVNKNYSLSCFRENAQFLLFTCNENLFDWLSKKDYLNGPFPDFLLNANLQVDSAFAKEFTGINVGISIDTLDFHSKADGMYGNIKIPNAEFEAYALEQFEFNIELSDKNKNAELRIEEIKNPYALVDTLHSVINFKSNQVAEFSLSSFFPEVSHGVALNAKIDLKPNFVNLSFDSNKTQQIGNQIWRAPKNKGILFDLENGSQSGELEFVNSNQKINYLSDETKMNLQIDSLQLAPIVALLLPGLNLGATLNLRANYFHKTGYFDFLGNINSIALDSLSLGYITYDGFKNEQKLNLNTHLLNPAGKLDVAFSKSDKETNAEIAIDKLNLTYLDSAFKSYIPYVDVKGTIDGKSNHAFGEKITSSGTFTFDNVFISNSIYGISAGIDKQEINFIDDLILLKNFTLTDSKKNKLIVDGNLAVSGNNKFDLSVFTSDFEVLNNENSKSDLKGKMNIDTRLALNGDLNNLNISGYLNTKAGAKINYFYKSGVSLDSRDDVITFVHFEKEESPQSTRKSKLKPINWNVNMNIGSTDLYVLISKTEQEYARLNASGELQLRKGKGITPLLLGTIQSSQGKVYYDAPVISTIELDIKSAKAQWFGEIANPVLSFNGSETFRVTPNEMSQDLKNNKDKIPVYVFVKVDQKPLNNLEISFDISSENSDVQTQLNALPTETREAYALNMLIFGKINSNAHEGSSVLDGVVNKLNEISRRNIKNAELDFHLDNYNEIKGVNTDAFNNLGYNFSKGFFQKRVKISIGGSVGFGNSSSAESQKFSPLDNIQLEYVLNKKPDISLFLSKNNTYRGPIDGRVDESTIGIGYSMNFDNLFKQKKDQAFKPKK